MTRAVAPAAAFRAPSQRFGELECLDGYFWSQGRNMPSVFWAGA